MPAYIEFVRIDWHVESTPPDLFPALVAANARCSSDDHTFETLRAELRKTAAAHPTLAADVLLGSGYNSFYLLRVRRGRVTEQAVEERPEGETVTRDLPYEDLVTVTLVRNRKVLGAALLAVDPDLDVASAIDLPTHYSSEALLRKLMHRIALAIDAGGGAFIAEAGDHDARFLVELVPGKAVVRALLVVTQPTLVARLLANELTPIPRLGRDPRQGYPCELDWPADMLAYLTAAATRVQHSVAYLVQYALRVARPKLEGASSKTLLTSAKAVGLHGGAMTARSIKLSGNTLDELEAFAKQHDCSTSEIARAAVALAKSDIDTF
ncbi:MAG: hypothetical protein WKG01_01010 [Kofleriaceae bacterium]